MSRQGITLSAKSGDAFGVTAAIASPAVVTHARRPESTHPAWHKIFIRLGGSRWHLERFDLDDPEGLFIPPAQLNALRRELIATLDAADDRRRKETRQARRQSLPPLAEPEPQTADALRKSLKLPLSLALSGPIPTEFHEIVLALENADFEKSTHLAQRVNQCRERFPDGTAFRLALPLTVRGARAENRMEQGLDLLLESGWETWEIPDPAGWYRLVKRRTGRLDISADSSFYVLNRLAAEHLSEMGIARFVAPLEASMEELAMLARMASPRVVVTVFAYPALFVSETPPAVPALEDGTIVRDRVGNRYRIGLEDGLWVTRPRTPFSRLVNLEAIAKAGCREVRYERKIPLDQQGGFSATYVLAQQGLSSCPAGLSAGNCKRDV